jgi:hypothetical protein
MKKSMLQDYQDPDVSVPNHYHDELTYDSTRENWGGIFSVLLVPAFILLFGWGLLSLFRLPQTGGGGTLPVKQDTVNGIKVGVGGGPGLTITTTPPVQNLQHTGTRLQPIQ